jgi:XTP/dITP diphosphohydrolase
MRLCFATNNLHKIQEVQAIVGTRINLVSLNQIGCLEELPEEQTTIEGNSFQKAKYVFDRYQIPCFADDSGVEVEALNGEPGVYSAMYAGPHRNHADNTTKLLLNLKDKANRKANFKTVLTLIIGQHQKQFIGTLEGTISNHQSGTNGFGYDPVFLPKGFSTTLAEMTMEEKNKISHRAKAIQQLVDFLNR